MGTKTKYFSSTQTGAPTLNGTVGSLIALLDALLVNGFGLQTATSVTIAGGVATVNVATQPSAVAGSVVLIAGATPAGLNGEQRVTSVTANSVSFATTETGTVTGAVTMKMAPAGWSKLYSGTNKAAYKIIDVTGSGCVLRVDDTNAKYARVCGYESMTDVDTGTGPFPATAQVAAPGLWWSKSTTADATARAWVVCADACGFYYMPANNGTTNMRQSSYFTDVLSLRSSDPYRCVLSGYPSDYSSTTAAQGNELSFNDASMSYAGAYYPRAANAVGGSVKFWTAQSMSMAGWAGQYNIGAQGATYPSLTDNGLMLTRIVSFNSTSIRGYLPGVYGTPQNVIASFNDGDTIAGTGDMAGKKLTLLKFGSGTGQNCAFIDPISDWR